MKGRTELVALALLLGGCLDRVSLGTDCVQGMRCGPLVGELPGTPGFPVQPGTPLDGSMMPSTVDATLPSDAGTPDDAGASADATLTLDAGDAGPELAFPALVNGSFEALRGDPGALAFSPLEPLPLGFTTSDSWGACRTGFSVLENAASTSEADLQDVSPSDGMYFLEVGGGVGSSTGLRQTLETPMRARTRYALRVDLRASAGAQVGLEIFGSQLDCVNGAKLAETVAVSDQGWQSFCLTFTPIIDTPQLVLVPASRGSGGGTNGRLFVDNLRRDPSCR